MATTLCLACVAGLTCCTLVGGSDDVRTTINAVDPVPVRVVVYQGADAMGLVDFMSKASDDAFHNDFRCVTSALPSSVNDSFYTGKTDIAVVPIILAMNMYARAPENVQIVSIASLSGQKVVSARKDLRSLEDLAALEGATLLMTGQGSMNEFVVRYLLAQKGLADQVTLQFVRRPNDIVAALSTDHEAIGVLSEPYDTAARFKDEELRPCVDLTAAWSGEVGEDVPMVHGVVLVRTAFAEAHPEAVAEFVEAQKSSIAAYDDDPDALAQLLVDEGVVDSLEIADVVLPSRCAVCVTGDEMHRMLTAFLELMHAHNPAWVGPTHELPADSFYYGVEVEDADAKDEAATDAEVEAVAPEDAAPVEETVAPEETAG